MKKAQAFERDQNGKWREAPDAMLVINGQNDKNLEMTVAGIRQILSATIGEQVQLKALEVLQHASQSAPVTVSNCTFDCGARVEIPGREERS